MDSFKPLRIAKPDTSTFREFSKRGNDSKVTFVRRAPTSAVRRARLFPPGETQFLRFDGEGPRVGSIIAAQGREWQVAYGEWHIEEKALMAYG